MKKNFELNTKMELNVDDMVDIACRSCLKDYGSNPKAKRLILAAIKNKKEIASAIKQSRTHKTANESSAMDEVHCIALVDGEAVLLKSLLLSAHGENCGCDKIMFVYEKTYNKYNYLDFQTDFYNGEGLDSVWCYFPYENVA